MFGWFKSKEEREIGRLEAEYARSLEQAEKELARSGDRARHGDMMTAAEAIGRQLDRAREALGARP